MPRALLLLVLLAPTCALAQTAPMPPHHHGAMSTMAVPLEPGQSAFAAIQEIVGILEADPATDWSKVNIEALRQHLIDMDSVTMEAAVEAEPVDGGMQFDISGTGPVIGSIQRMVAAHAATMDGVDDWHFAATETAEGAVLTVTVPESDQAKLRGLGFIGVMTHGMHHQMHHLMLARGEHPHH